MVVVESLEGISVICEVDGRMTLYLPRCLVNFGVRPGDVLAYDSENDRFFVNDIETALRREAIERYFSAFI